MAIGVKSRFRPIWAAFLDLEFELVVSDEILYEYEEILQQHARSGIAGFVMEVFAESTNVIHPQVYYTWNAIKSDPDDNKFFDTAVAGNADFIVTNDAHFNVLKHLPFPSVNVISANDFLGFIENSLI
ncbi:putative toxin-antitoxin system toxin component, PIN family [Mucilaginibacter psychrotolerans]|uniref:putative toxin-antitoxin system toxin component, PIN family n=1 Tax=Mucilaginibacter psychrotolerans TaxID=1524096 RepID=UPI00195BD756|nr:putative toxin-antitoxin system toxin component, PIN family [Mucilaginibacter psychrotolerans]